MKNGREKLRYMTGPNEILDGRSEFFAVRQSITNAPDAPDQLSFVKYFRTRRARRKFQFQPSES